MWRQEIKWRTICIQIVAALVVLMKGARSECGGYKDSDVATSGNITSPNFPSLYPNYANCIWLLKAPDHYVVSLEIGPVKGQNKEGACVDYVEVRDGSRRANLRYKECNKSSNTLITSPGRTMWIRFSSDGFVANTGFHARWAFKYQAINYTKTIDQEQDCNSYSYQCRNKECISWSYRCDGYNDCGCDVDGCDEHGCQGLNLDSAVVVGIGVGVGTAIFLILFFAVLGIETYNNFKFNKKALETQQKSNKKRSYYTVKPPSSLTLPGDEVNSKEDNASWKMMDVQSTDFEKEESNILNIGEDRTLDKTALKESILASIPVSDSRRSSTSPALPLIKEKAEMLPPIPCIKSGKRRAQSAGGHRSSDLLIVNVRPTTPPVSLKLAPRFNNNASGPDGWSESGPDSNV